MSWRNVFSRLQLFWVLQISGWSLYGVFYYFLNYALADKYLDTKNIIGLALTYLAAIIVTLVLRQIYHRVFERTKQLSRILWTGILGTVFGAVVWLLVDRSISIPLWGMEQFWRWMNQPLFMQFRQMFFDGFMLLTWSSLYFFIKFWREWNVERDRSEKAELLAHSAQLQMLRYQLNPHFLFNSLNSIRALVEEDPGKARETITELAELLRYSLTSQGRGNVPLETELEAIRHYFAIEEKRYEDNLQVEYEIDADAEQFTLPNFLLHPLVENAVKYGMQTSDMPLRIRIKAGLKGNVFELSVFNSGQWLPEDRDRTTGTGTGLANIRQRLENAFPGRSHFSKEADKDGVKVHIRITREGP